MKKITVLLIVIVTTLSSKSIAAVNWTPFTRLNISISDNHVNGIAIDAEGAQWFATNGGVSKFNGIWTNYIRINGLASDTVYTVTIDSLGNKWFGTKNGISKFDGTTWTTYTIADGLISDTVYSIVIDSKGVKWIGTK